MGKYSKVKYSLLLKEVNFALEEIKDNNLNKKINDLKDYANLNSSARKAITESIENIISSKTIDSSIKNITTKLNNLKTALGHIEKCQEYEKSIERYRKKLSEATTDENMKVYIENEISDLKYKLLFEESLVDNLLD